MTAGGGKRPQPSAASTQERWLAGWMEAASRDGAMSQRRLASIEAYGGGLEAAAAAARAAGVHLVLLTDDKGDKLVAASRHPFKVIV